MRSVVEGELARRRAADPHLRLEPRHLEPGRVRLDEERRDAPVAAVGIRLREHRVEVRDARVRDEALRAVQDVLVAVRARRRAHRRRVGARARLRQRVRAEPFAAREPRQILLLLLLGAGELHARASRAPAPRGSARSSRRPSRPPRSRPAQAACRCRARRTARRRTARRCRSRGRARPRPTETRATRRSPPRAARSCSRAIVRTRLADLALLVA